jgi:hypothetical protein
VRIGAPGGRVLYGLGCPTGHPIHSRKATTMARVPIEEGFFRIPDDPGEPPRLLGSRCPACGEAFFPRR